MPRPEDETPIEFAGIIPEEHVVNRDGSESTIGRIFATSEETAQAFENHMVEVHGAEVIKPGTKGKSFGLSSLGRDWHSRIFSGDPTEN
jgi:hypothetical protein